MTEQRTKSRRAVFIRHRKATTPRAIRIKQRQAETLKLRQRGLLYPEIAKRMRCGVRTVKRYAAEAMAEMLPAEECAEALKLELAWIDEMKAGLYEQSKKGDFAAIREARGLIDLRAKLLGLYPSGPGDQHQHLHLNGDAKQLGIAVTFRAPDPDSPMFHGDEPPRTIEHQRALPPPSQSDWRAPSKPEELPSNVTPLESQRSRSNYDAKHKDEQERAIAEGWTSDKVSDIWTTRDPNRRNWMR